MKAPLIADKLLEQSAAFIRASQERATSEYSEMTSEYMQDAARWRWIRSHLDDDTDYKLMEHKKGCDYGMKQFAALDDAVDAAMANISIDCPKCHGWGYDFSPEVEDICGVCGGSGEAPKEQP